MSNGTIVPNVAVPGTVVPSGSLTSPGGATGIQGIQGPTAVSANAGNLAQLGTDNLILVPQNTVQGLNHYYGPDTGNGAAFIVSVNSDFRLVPGVVVWVTPSNGNSGANPTLNVNGTGAIPIVNRANMPLLFANSIEINRMFGVVYDGTSWRLITPTPLSAGYTNVVNPSPECAGFDSVIVYCGVSATTGQGLTLNHLAHGVPVTIIFNNSTAAVSAYYIRATTPAGSAYNVYWIWANSISTGATLVDITASTNQSASSWLMFQGQAQGNTLFLK
jgi:hypothetical protein